MVENYLQPDTLTGDIVFVLQQKEHPKYKRKGDDLFVEHTLSLTEALCGFQFVLTHLDNRQLLIKSNPGEVVKPGKLISILSFLSLYTLSFVSLHKKILVSCKCYSEPIMYCKSLTVCILESFSLYLLY